MPVSPEQLAEIGQRFISSMNARDYVSATSLYAPYATYESMSLLRAGCANGRISGRHRIIDYFKSALHGDNDFRLSTLDCFTGLNVTIILSSAEGKTFVDVLKTNDDGLITEHLEVSPKPSPIGYLAAPTT